MKAMLKLAARNVWRNKRRSLITMAAIALGLALMIWGRNLNEGSYRAMIDVGVSQMAGHVVVQAPGFQQDKDVEQVVEGASAIAGTLERAFPEARVVTRSFLGGLLTSPQNSVGVGLNAIQPDREITVVDWDDKITSGSWFEPDAERGIVLGVGLAAARRRRAPPPGPGGAGGAPPPPPDSLEVETGDKVVFMTQGSDEVTSRLFRVRGIMTSGSKELDGFFALAPLPAVQELLERPDTAHQISVHFEDGDLTVPATDEARELLAGHDVEVLPWMEAIPEIYQMIQMDQQYNYLFMFIIGLIVAVGVANTVLMAVMERIREFGVLLAVGMSPKRLGTLVVVEGTVLGALSVLLGVALGAALTWPLVVHGWDLTPYMGESYEVEGVAISAVLYAVYDWPSTVLFAACGIGMTILATLYPAMKAARLEPVEAMHHA